MVGDNDVRTFKTIARAEKRALLEIRASIITAAPMICRHSSPCTIGPRLDPTVQFTIPTTLRVAIKHFLIQHREIFTAHIKYWDLLLVLVFQVIIKAFQAHVAAAPFRQTNAKG